MKNINIREALLELDKRTSCQYDLTTLYEACKLNDEDKNQLVKYIDAYDHPSVIGGFLASKCEALSEELGDDDVSDLKLIDDINCGEDHTLWSLADKLEDDALELKELTEDIAPDEKAAIAGRVREAAAGVLVGKLGYEEDFVDNYMTIDVDDIDDNTRIKVEVRAEVDYDGLMTLGQALDPIVKEYDKNAYFEPVTSGIMSAYIRKDQSDDIPDEAAVKEWTDRFNACQTKDDVIAVYRDLIKVRDNNEVTWGTIEAIYDVIDAKMDSLGESLNEALFTVPTDYEDYCPYCANRALKGVGDGRAVCDSCGAEYEVTALGNDKVRLDPLFIGEAVTCSTDGKSYITESTLITPVRNGYHNLWNISDNLVVHDDGGVYHVVQKDGWKNTYIFNSADIEEVNDFLMAHYDVALARANPTEEEDKENARLTDEEKNELINIVAMSFETGHFSFDNFEDFKNECSHMTNLEAAWAYYNELVNMGPAGFYEEFKDVYDFDDMFVSEYGVNESIEESLVEGDQLDSKFADERYEFAPQDGVIYKSYIGDKEVPYETYEDAKAHLKDDFKITDFRADLQQFLTDNDCHHTVDETTDGRLVISINWGDWKHDHMQVDALVDEFFNNKGLVVKTQKETTEEDGSDTYSAEHYYDIDSLYFKRVPVEEALNPGHKHVSSLIAGDVIKDGGVTSTVKSIENKSNCIEVTFEDGSSASYDHKEEVEVLTETIEDAQYGVHSFSQDAIIFRGTEEECGKYIDQHKELWDDAEVYKMTPDDPHYRKEEKLTLSESDDTDILYNTEDPDDYDGIEAGHQFIEDGHEWTLFKQCGETVHLDFDNWAVWWAYRPEIDGDENSTAISGFFVIDVDTGFIDWGPCDTVEEAQQFLQSKVDDYNMDEAIEPEKVFDKDGNEIEPPLGRCKCGKALVAGEGEEPHCPKCGNSISESINVGDKVKVTTPGNNHYDGRIGVVDYAEDGIVTVKFDDDKSPKLNNFDLNQVTRIDESKPQELDESLFDDDFSDEEIASVLGGDIKNDIPDGLETPDETEARLKAMNEEADVTDVATATLEGPEEGAAAGVASLINDAIQDELKTADEYNAISITAKAEGHEDIAAVIDEINTEEHKHIGQLEKALEKVAPNAEAIEVGKIEGEQQLGEVTDTVVVKEGIQPNDLAANVEDAFVRDELDLFVADALSDGSATEETLLTIANDSSNIELDDMKKAINAYKESLDTNNSNSTLNNNSDKDVLEESEVTESWEKIYQSFKTIEKELNQDGEAVTAVIDKMYQDNKHDPDYQKAYDKWASGE